MTVRASKFKSEHVPLTNYTAQRKKLKLSNIREVFEYDTNIHAHKDTQWSYSTGR